MPTHDGTIVLLALEAKSPKTPSKRTLPTRRAAVLMDLVQQ